MSMKYAKEIHVHEKGKIRKLTKSQADAQGVEVPIDIHATLQDLEARIVALETK